MNKLIVPMRKIVFLQFAILAGMLFAFTATAQEQATTEHKKAARAAMETTGATARLDQILPQLASFTKAGLIANRPDIEAEISELVDDVAISLAERRGDLEQEIVAVYTRVYTQEELEAIAGFFGSEAGKKFLEKTPFVIKEVDQISGVWRNGINRDMTTQVREKLKEKNLQ